ncbi:MAG: hypothetical protein K0U93_22945 [Gammaproteobacteria bacterium]|nr:hypothetical protein [Gammaproteobacteria bacterium]
MSDSTPLTCTDCGQGFVPWDGYTDQGKCVGFGVCVQCQAIARRVTRNSLPPRLVVVNGSVWGFPRLDAPVDHADPIPLGHTNKEDVTS